MKLVYSAMDIRDANRVANVLRQRSIKCKVLGKSLYYSNYAPASKGLNPLTIWITDNAKYHQAIRAIWDSDTKNGIRRTRDYPKFNLSKRQKFFLTVIFVVTVVYASVSLYPT